MKKIFIYLTIAAFIMNILGGCSENEAIKEDLIGTWNLSQGYVMDMTWESSGSITIDGLVLPTSAIAGIATEYCNAQLREKMKSLTFRENDNLEVAYLDDGTGNWKTDIIGTYKLISRNKFQFYPDEKRLLEDIGGMAGSPLVSEIKALAATTGFSVNFTFIGQNASRIRFYLDTKTMKEGGKVIVPMLYSLIFGDSVDDDILQILQDELPGLLEKTDKMEIGFSFSKENN